MRRLMYLLLGILTLVLQGTLMPAIFGGPWLPNLILVWIIMLAILRSRQVALTVAVIGGILYDTVLSNFFGLHLFPYVITAYAMSSWAPRVYEEQWYMSALLVAGGSLLDGLLRMAMLFFMEAQFSFVAYALHFVLPEMVANGLLGIVVHWILWRFDKKEEYRW